MKNAGCRQTEVVFRLCMWKATVHSRNGVNSLAFMLLYCKSRTNLEMIRYAVLYILLASSSLKDYKERIVSNKLVAAGIVLDLLWRHWMLSRKNLYSQ